MLIIGILLFGMLVGAAAQWVLGRDGRGIDWGMALVAGLAGSFVGGLLASLLAGDGLEIQPERTDRLVRRRRRGHADLAGDRQPPTPSSGPDPPALTG